MILSASAETPMPAWIVQFLPAPGTTPVAKHWSVPGVSAQMTLEKGILMGVAILATVATILQCRKPPGVGAAVCRGHEPESRCPVPPEGMP